MKALYFLFGCETVTEQVNKHQVINVELQETSQMVDEVIITVPYGTAKKSTFTGSASFIPAGTIEKAQVSSVSKALQGTVAGLSHSHPGGRPGSDATIFIRGVGSVNASTNPLYVVDGVPYDGALSSLLHQTCYNRVERMQLLLPLYGSRAANGVIMITTKQRVRRVHQQWISLPSMVFSSRARVLITIR